MVIGRVGQSGGSAAAAPRPSSSCDASSDRKINPAAARPPERERARTAPETPIPEDQGYGVNLINMRDPREDIFDIPTFLRRQMD